MTAKAERWGRQLRTAGVDAGVATAVKHYPSLGRVTGNTDFETHVVDTTTTRSDPALQGFTVGAVAGVDMVLASSTYYAKIDKAHRAVFSKIVMQEMLRDDLHFSGLVVSDDLSAQAVRDFSPGKRAVSFLSSGGDLIIVGDAGEVPAMVTAIKERAKSDPDFRAELAVRAARVLQMKARRAMTNCG